MEQGNIRIYGTGGFGINIASFFDAADHNAAEPGHSIPHPVYIDTSRSNLKSGLNPDHIFLLEGVDGSGKVRRENHEEIAKNVRSIIQQFPPLDFNIVVFSASGGSGSVFGPLIIRELLSRKLPVAAIVVGSVESNITAQNTLNTCKSLEAIAEKTHLPVVMYYEQNDLNTKRSEVDAACRSVISHLSILCSKRNHGMDTMDITNWVQYNNSTSVKPRLALLDTYTSNESVFEATQPIAIASLYDDPDADQPMISPEYVTAGYPLDVQAMNESSAQRSHAIAGARATHVFHVLHFVITVAGVQVIAKDCQKRIDELNELRDARVDHASIVGSNDKLTDQDLVL